MASPKQQFNWRETLPAAALVVLVLIVYFPAISGEFLWDDDSNIIKSAPLRSLGGLFRIWFQPGITQQYYPLTHTSWWLDFHIWGLHTTGYHLENILLHGISAVLVWVLLRRLSVKGAWLGAALFALHPVNVESVAWITERKNALSGVFFIGSLIAAARFWQLDCASANEQSAQPTANETGPWKFYALALGMYLCALWSKTATVGLPAVIWLLLWWKRGLPRWRNVWLLLPFVIMGIGMSLITIWIEKNHLGATGEEWGFTPIQRIVIAGRAWWFYLGKLAWPHPLMFMYPLWNTQSPSLLAYLAPVVACVVVALLCVKRKTWARPILFAAGYFFVMLFPVLGFFNVVFYHYSFVSDHFQYLACIGPLALVGAGISSAFGSAKNYNPIVGKVVCGLLLTVLAVMSWRQAGVYRSPETLWHDTLAHNPKSWMAHDNLGTCYSMEGKFDEAKAEYLNALEIRPTDHMAYNDLGLDAARMGKLDDAVQYFGKALQTTAQLRARAL